MTTKFGAYIMVNDVNALSDKSFNFKSALDEDQLRELKLLTDKIFETINKDFNSLLDKAFEGELEFVDDPWGFITHVTIDEIMNDTVFYQEIDQKDFFTQEMFTLNIINSYTYHSYSAGGFALVFIHLMNTIGEIYVKLMNEQVIPYLESETGSKYTVNAVIERLD